MVLFSIALIVVVKRFFRFQAEIETIAVVMPTKILLTGM